MHPGAYLASCAPFITILCESQLLPSLKEFPGLTAFFVRSERLEGVRFWKTGSKARLEAFFLAKREEARAAAASALIKLQHDAILSLLKEFSRAVKLESVQGDAAKEKLMNIQAGFNRLHDVLLEHEAMEDQHLFPEIDRAKVGSAESLHGGCKDETPITNGILQDIKMAISVSHDSRGLDRLMGSLQEKAEHLLVSYCTFPLLHCICMLDPASADACIIQVLRGPFAHRVGEINSGICIT